MTNKYEITDIHELANTILANAQGTSTAYELADMSTVAVISTDELRTVSGMNPVVIYSPYTNSSNKVIVNILPVQTGSGVPSPTNVRPISGWTSIDVVRTTYDPQTETTYSVDLSPAGTVYVGTLDVTTGLLTVTHGILDLGTLTWELWPGLTSIFRCSLPSYIKKVENSIRPNWLCEIYEVREGTAISSSNNTIGQIHKSYLVTDDRRYTNAVAYKSAMNGVHLCYELASYHTYQLTPKQVMLVRGENMLSVDSPCTMDVTYIAERSV